MSSVSHQTTQLQKCSFRNVNFFQPFFCTPFKVIGKFPIDGYLLPNNLGVAVVLFLVNTD